MVTMIGIAGPKRTGKDTLCEFIADAADDMHSAAFVQGSLIAPFRTLAAQMFGPVADKEAVLEPFGFTWRQFMQQGCDKLMELHPDIFYRTAVTEALQRKYTKVIFTDVRHERSAELIREAGGVIVHLDPQGFVRTDPHASEAPLKVQPGDYVFSYPYGDYEDYKKRAKVFALMFTEKVFT